MLWEKEEYIRDFAGRNPIGIIRTYANGDQEAIDFNSRHPLGRYKKALDQTTDFYGRPLSKGNTVVSLIYKQNSKR